MNLDNNEAPGHRSFGWSNRTPYPGDHRAELETERTRPIATTEISINPNDVLCGRGKVSFNHVGNKRFRNLISRAVGKYNEAESRLAKAGVVNLIVEEIKVAGGRFLRRDEPGGTWHALNLGQCREKVGHAIRDATSGIQARKKRISFQEAARKCIAGAIFAKPPRALSNADDTGFSVLDAALPNSSSSLSMRKETISMGISNLLESSEEQSFFVDEAARRSVVAGLSPLDAALPNSTTSISVRSETSSMQIPDFLESSEEQTLFGDDREDQLIQSEAPFDFLQEWQEQGVYPKNFCFKHFWTAPTCGATSVDVDDDDQFLAYIDHVLGPLSPATS